MNKTKFTYNKTFQGKVIAALATDKIFLKKIYPILDETMFETDEFQRLISWIKSYFEKYSDIVSRDYIESEIDEISDTQKTLKSSTRNWYKKIFDVLINSSDLEYVKDDIFEFFSNQNWKKTIFLSADYAENGEFDKIHPLIKKAYDITNYTDLGTEYAESIDSRYNENARVTISTGYVELDEVLRGGFGNGDLITVIAPSGTGKSWLLANFGANAMKAGKNILHYTLELTANQTAQRYDMILTKSPIIELERDTNIVKEYLDNNPNTGKLISAFYPMNSVTVPKIKAHAEQVRADKFKPEMIIIDYGDLIKPTTKYSDKRLNLEEVFNELKQMAQELDIPVITASQSNRSGVSKSVIQNDDIAESFNKVFVSDIILTFARKLEDKINDVGNLNISKNRHGRDGVVFEAETKLMIGQIMIKSENNALIRQHLKQQNANNNNDFLKKNLSNFRSKKDSDFHKKVSGLG